MGLDIFFTQNPYNSWGSSHFVPVLIFALIGVISISIAKKFLSRNGRKRLLLFLSLVPFICYPIYLLMQIAIGEFTIQNDLPIHLCRFLALAAPLVYWKENKLWTGIFYFWILVGTINAVIAVDLKYDIPHWTYFLYFTMHCSLVLLPIYYCLVLGHRVSLRDIWNAFWASNLFLLIAMAVNFAIGSNYMYSSHKPNVASLLDLLGPWPWYLVTLQFIGLGLFFVVFLPFLFAKEKEPI